MNNKMCVAFLLLENHFFRTPDGKIWCDRVIDYNYLKRYLQSFDQIILCGRLSEITKREAKVKKIVTGSGVSFIGLPNFTGAVGTLRNLLKIKSIIRKNLKEADCAILRGPSPLSLMVYNVFKKSSKPFAVEFVMAANKMFDSDRLLYRIINRALVRRAKKMCLAANGVAYVTDHILQDKYPCRKAAFTTNYSSIDLDADFFYQQKWYVENPPKCFNIVHTGYMDSNRKGQDVLINAAKQMVEAGRTNFKITFIGDGKIRTNLEKMVADYKLDHYIDFVGAINDKDKIREILMRSHLFVFPSRSEGLPRSIIEAMAIGLVCVASPIDGIPEIVDDKYLVEGWNGDAYAKKITKITRNWPEMINESKKNNQRAKDFEKTTLDKRRRNFYDELKRLVYENKNFAVDGTVDGKKITLLISQLSGGGAERVTCNLANYLNRKGYKVDLIALSETNDAYAVDDGVSKVCLLKRIERKNLIVNNLVRFVRLKKYVKNHKDVSCYVSMLPLPSFMLTMLKKQIRGKIIVSERCNPATHAFLDKKMMNVAVRRSDALVVQTREIGDWYKDKVNKIIIPNAINKDVKLPKRMKIENKIVAVGRLEKQKNYPMLIRAFALISNDFPDYKMEIYGQGSQEKELKAIVDKCGLNNKINFMGYEKEISSSIVKATCFVITSDYEGISNALVEAMCMGLPCIATDSDGGGTRTLIRDGVNGLIVKKGDVEGLAEKMELMLSDDKFTQQLGKKAKEIRRELAYEKIYAKWMFYIKMVVENDI